MGSEMKSSNFRQPPNGAVAVNPADRIPHWITELAEQIRPLHTALLLVDMQNDFVDDEGVFVRQWGKTNHWTKPIIPWCQKLLGVARQSGVAVVHLRVVNDLLRNPVSWHHFWGPPASPSRHVGSGADRRVAAGRG